MLRAEVNFSQWINQKIWPKVCVLPRWVTKRNHPGKVETPYLSPSSQHLLLTSSFFHSYLCVFLRSKIYFCLLCKFPLKFPLGFIWSDRIFCTFIPKEKRVSRNQKEKKKGVSTSIRMTKLKNKQTGNSEYWHRCGATRPLTHCWRECETAQPLWKKFDGFF